MSVLTIECFMKLKEEEELRADGEGPKGATRYGDLLRRTHSIACSRRPRTRPLRCPQCGARPLGGAPGWAPRGAACFDRASRHARTAGPTGRARTASLARGQRRSARRL